MTLAGVRDPGNQAGSTSGGGIESTGSTTGLTFDARSIVTNNTAASDDILAEEGAGLSLRLTGPNTRWLNTRIIRRQFHSLPGRDCWSRLPELLP